MQQALDTKQQLPLASAPSRTWHSSMPTYDTDWFSRYISTPRTRTEIILVTLVFLPFNQLTQLVAQEHFIIIKPQSSHSFCNYGIHVPEAWWIYSLTATIHNIYEQNYSEMEGDQTWQHSNLIETLT
jgi:hypothetical protein